MSDHLPVLRREVEWFKRPYRGCDEPHECEPIYCHWCEDHFAEWEDDPRPVWDGPTPSLLLALRAEANNESLR